MLLLITTGKFCVVG